MWSKEMDRHTKVRIWFKLTIKKVHNKAERSLISSDYANRFIREFIIKEKEQC